ncbi:PKD domain-containing protein [Pedobacter sp. BS3]|uniref:PKD domain-containing protein n=1 Tax=Pedobacter sp. BS3 TaxID=2567937 RepID=UPI001659865D|nr:PKD domain-containing protein [Pedobacter sp. BS3]
MRMKRLSCFFKSFSGRFAIYKAPTKRPYRFVLSIVACMVIQPVWAQVTFDFSGVSAVPATPSGTGYTKTGIGTYYRSTSGSTMTFDTGSANCDGFNVSAGTGSSLFIFKADMDIATITVRGNGTGSNRTFSAFAINTSANLNGSYASAAYTATGGIGTGGAANCGAIVVTPAAIVSAGTYMRLTFSGNINVTSIVLTPAVYPVPTIQASNVSFTNVGRYGLTVNWVNGNGSNRAVFVKQGTGTTTGPADNEMYTASADWNNGNPAGTQLGTSGYYCVYKGSGNSVTLTNLNPSATYTVQVFEYNGPDNQSSFLTSTAANNPNTQTTQALAEPTITTQAISNIRSTKATGGGTVTDDGGLPITEKGLVWNTVGSPSLGSNTGKLIINDDLLSFSGLMNGLSPDTRYYVRAYAINSTGTSYGNEVEFTTAIPAPILLVSKDTLDFGENYYNAEPAVMSYTLSSAGLNLSPAAGTITVNASGGFLVSTDPNSGFAPSVTLSYTNGKVEDVPVYVQLPTGRYGAFSGEITYTGGGVAADDADKIKLLGRVVQSELSNKGTDFWLGFGYQEKMNEKAGASGEAKMSVYVTTGAQEATVHVELPNGGYSQTVTIPANSVHEFTDFPTGDPSNNTNPSNMPDSRLFSTGVSKKAVHVYSDNEVPVSVFLHTYTNSNSAAGAMIFPTNTWSSSYTVQAYGGTSNNSNPNSFFFVIANEDNTLVTFTPTQPILDASSASLFNSNTTTSTNTAYTAGGTYSVMLNKGEVFNAMGGYGPGKFGLDLSGTVVKTTCDKKIAVFGGNGRVLVNSEGCSASSGSDHLIQQMFPSVAWGTKYLTAPTRTMEYNYFRIYIQDAATQVKVNGTVLDAGTLVNNLYYEYSSKDPLLIESDRPINVSQFITAASCATAQGSVGNGDPEMIILSPVQQSITDATVYSASFRGTSASPKVKPALPDGTIGNCASFINVVIPKEGVASFKLDGKDVADIGIISTDICPQDGSNRDCIAFSASTTLIPMSEAFKPHPQDASYAVATFWVETGAQHTLSSTVGFNAIAYGVGDGESYGYNAGTTIKNLSSVKMAVNAAASDTSSASVKAAKGTPTTLRIALPYNPFLVDNIVWDTGNDARISPAGAQNGAIDNGTGKAKYEGTVVIDGRTFYVYNSPVKYTFSEDGNYTINAKAVGTFAGDCTGEDLQKITIVAGHDDIKLDYATNCGNPVVNFANTTQAMAGTSIVKWAWDFGDNSTSDLQNPPAHTYNKSNGSVYTVKLTTTNSAGIVSSKSIQVDFSGEVTAEYAVDAPGKAICFGGTVNFNASPSRVTNVTAGAPVKWTWNFGEGDDVIITGSSSPVQSHIYNTPGNYEVKLTLETASGCQSTFTDHILVSVLPTPVVTSEATINSITFKWDAVPGANSYQVSTDNGVTFTDPSSGPASTTHTITGLNTNQVVTLIVKATGEGVCQSLSEPLTAKTDLPELDVYVPNTFTPNGDGKNDELKVYSNYIQSISMKVFNQWGQMIFSTTEKDKGWDGTYKGEQQPVGVYIYVVSVTLQDGKTITKKGAVNLIR